MTLKLSDVLCKRAEMYYAYSGYPGRAKAIQYWWGGIWQWRKFPFSEAANCYKLIRRASSPLTSPFNVASTDTESDRLKSCVSSTVSANVLVGYPGRRQTKQKHWLRGADVIWTSSSNSYTRNVPHTQLDFSKLWWLLLIFKSGGERALWKNWVLTKSVGKTCTQESQWKGVSPGNRGQLCWQLPPAFCSGSSGGASSGVSRAPRASWGQDRDTCLSPLSSPCCQGYSPRGGEGCWLQDEIGVGAAGRELREIMQMQLPWQAEKGGKHVSPVFPSQKVPPHYFWWWPALGERKEGSPFYK